MIFFHSIFWIGAAALSVLFCSLLWREKALEGEGLLFLSVRSVFGLLVAQRLECWLLTDPPSNPGRRVLNPDRPPFEPPSSGLVLCKAGLVWAFETTFYKVGCPFMEVVYLLLV